MKKIYLPLISFLMALIQGASAQNFSSVDIYSGNASSDPYDMTAFNGKVYFQAQADTATGYELYMSDGTAAGTVLVADIWPGPGSSNPGNFVILGSKMLFVANDSLHGTELWITDGTTAGTTLLDDIWAGPGSSYPADLTVMNGKVYFAAYDSLHGSELWVTDGTTAGTSLLKDILPGPNGSQIFVVGPGPDVADGYTGYSHYFTELNNKLYFAANDSIHGSELWVTDGTTAGTNMITDIWPGPGSGFPYCITAFNGNLYMDADDSVHGAELWVSDGTAAGTSMLKDINPGILSSSPGNWMAISSFNGMLYFDATTPANGDELWVSDGTTSGTTLLKDILPGPGSAIGFGWNLQAFNGKMYFNANDSVNGDQLWVSDGTSSGTSLLKVLSATTPYLATPRAFINYNGSLIFIANTDAVNQNQLFISDGTAAGTHILAPAIAPNTNPLNNPPSFCIFNNDLFMSADFNSIGDELWIYGFPEGITPVGGEQLISAYPNPFGSSVSISGLESSGQYTVLITDMSGREYYNTTISNPSQNVSVSMPDLATGVYLMRIAGQGSSQTFKLVKN